MYLINNIDIWIYLGEMDIQIEGHRDKCSEGAQLDLDRLSSCTNTRC
jgi:hypothetical protein